jgi:hypothetical protein
VIFAKPRHFYQSYTDFWTLVELCGYPVVFTDEIDPDLDTTYIYTGPDASLEFKEGKARIIYWLLEWYGDYYQRPGVTETWVSNKTYADMVGARYVPMGSHPELGTTEKLKPQYDIIHLSYDAIHRRRNLLDRLIEHNYAIAPNGWDDARDKALRSSHAMLHIHQHEDFPGIAPLRIALGAAYGLPVMCENGWDIAPYNEAIFHTPYNNLIVEIIKMMGDATERQHRAEALHNLLCHELRFDKVVESNL